MPENTFVGEDYREWQVPPAAVTESRKLGWHNEIVEEGQAWLKSQRGYSDFRKSLDTISGRDSIQTSAPYRSKLNTNHLKRNLREMIGTLAKLRPLWGYHSDNKAYKSQANMFNLVTKAWYLESFADRKIREALQYAAATCRGWAIIGYRRAMYGRGKGDIHLSSYGSPCVLPYQLPASNDWQEAYAVTVLDELPVAMAHGMFPAFQHRLRPSASRYWYSNDGVRKATQGNWIQRAFGQMKRTSGSTELSDLLIPFRRTWIIDLALNTSSSPILMGEPGSSWAYTVPPLGSDIYVGDDPKSGTRMFRKADENDARLYPNRRLMISTDTVVVYDGPSFDWHGMFPGVSFCTDDWAWEPLGFAAVHEGYELNEAIKEIDRGNMDKVRSQLNMSLAYDSNAVSSREAKSFDPMAPRGRVGYDGSALEGTPFTPVLPPEVLEVQATSLQLRETFQGAMDDQMAIRDVMALAKMRAVGSMDELEKIIEAQGPIVEDISRTMEPPMRDLGVMLKYCIMQYYTTARVMQIVGPDGVTPETFDYDPTKIVPSHLPGENPDNQSRYTPVERARIMADNLRFFILPNSLHEMSQMVMKLGLIQLKKAGVMIDSQTIAEAWNIPNYGSFEGNTVLERFKNEQEQQLEFAARMKELAGGLGLGTPGAPPGAPKPGGGKPEGRPSTDAAPATLQSKDGGARSTIATSQ